MSTVESLRRQLREAQENLALIEERQSQYVQETDIPLQLIKDERHTRQRIRRLERQLHDLRPIAVLRQSTKLIVGPVARELDGRPWYELRQDLLTQASKLPWENYLDVPLMEASRDELIRLGREIEHLLAILRSGSDPELLQPLSRRAGTMAALLLRIYRLQPGAAPELEALTAGREVPGT